MKKYLLCGLSALSAVSLAVSNPGDNAATANTKNKAEVGVPMEVRINILPKNGRLILVDENNVLIKKLVFDHGDIIMGGALADSRVEKEVKLTTDDKTAFGGHKVQFLAKDSSGTVINAGSAVGSNTNKFVLNGHGEASSEHLDSQLEYRQDEITTKATDTEVVTKVVSIIPATEINRVDKSGLFVGNGTFEATVTKKD